MMLLQAAADEWKVPVAEVSVADGVITHAGSGRKTTYGKVAAAAAKLTPPDPKSITLKNPKDWKIAGKPMKRLDTADKLNGSKVYAIDLKLPGMLHAAIKACPVFGGKLVSYDEAKIAGPPRRPRRRQGERLHRGRGRRHVVAGQVRARGAADRLGRGRRAPRSRARRSPSTSRRGWRPRRPTRSATKATRLAAIQGAAKKVEAVYSTPFLAHATMEPMNCTVKISADRAECWVPTQNSEASLAALSEQSGVPLAKCEVYRHDLGGGFGRRGGNQDYVRQARQHRQAVPRRPGQDDLVARRGHGARLLPADLAVQAGRGPRRQGRARRPARARLRPVDQRVLEPGADRERQGRSASSRATRTSPATRSSATRCRIC